MVVGEKVRVKTNDSFDNKVGIVIETQQNSFSVRFNPDQKMGEGVFWFNSAEVEPEANPW